MIIEKNGRHHRRCDVCHKVSGCVDDKSGGLGYSLWWRTHPDGRDLCSFCSEHIEKAEKQKGVAA